MKLPDMLATDGIGKSVQVKFGGYNHTKGCSDGELWDMENLCGEEYPLLAVRKPRKRLAGALTKPNGIFGYGKLLTVDGTVLSYGGVPRGTVSDSRKSFAAIFNRIVIWPDKKVLNVTYERKGVYATLSALEAAVAAPAEGDAYGIGASMPYTIYVRSGGAWVSNGPELDDLEKSWSGTGALFGNGTLYGASAKANMLQVSGTDWSALFREGDAVTITGCTTHAENNKTPIIREISGDKLYFYEDVFTLDSGDAAYTEPGTVTVRRAVPELDCICANANRVWGGKGDVIYCSKLGDPYNWNVYDGIASDSWYGNGGTAGDWTGCVSYGGYPVFMKPDTITKVYGTLPTDYDPESGPRTGCAEGSGRSFAAAEEVLYYLAPTGICAYKGGLPVSMAAPFGVLSFRDAVAGSDGRRYYVSMQDADGAWQMYVYDTQAGGWYRESGMEAVGFAKTDCLYCLGADGVIRILSGTPAEAGWTEETPVSWYAEFGDFTDSEPNAKKLSRIQIRIGLEAGASCTVSAQYDSGGTWTALKSITAGEKRTYNIPVRPRRADHYRLKLTGEGGCVVWSIARSYAAGSAHATWR